MKKYSLSILCIIWYLLFANTIFAFSRKDTLRGSNGDGRNWWNVTHYSLSVSFDTLNQSISGSTVISFEIASPVRDSMQIDLQEPMHIDSIIYEDKAVFYKREGNVYWLSSGFINKQSTRQQLIIYYSGKPPVARNAPWDGGFIWKKDDAGKPVIAVACQGLGASIWWPCKDYQGDEPDKGMNITLKVPQGLKAISNGKNNAFFDTGDQSIWSWKVTQPINSYCATFYIGDYISWQDTLIGENGVLPLHFYVLRQNEDKARKQFSVVKQMLHCFEYWMGPYPFYEDSYKLVESPYLGMEHQSAVAYGNKYQNGYLGRDQSGTGYGLLFDFIIIHETGHEWFGNNITAVDIADNWIHEGFTTYTEALFLECITNKETAYAYVKGQWKTIKNDAPVVGKYGVQDDGSGDKYSKGQALVHSIRVLLNNDEKFRALLRHLNYINFQSFVTTDSILRQIELFTRLDLAALSEQYLHTTEVPTLQYYYKKNRLYYRFTNTVNHFSLPVHCSSRKQVLKVTARNDWQQVSFTKAIKKLKIKQDFYMRYAQLSKSDFEATHLPDNTN